MSSLESPRWPVSVKGVLIYDNAVLLLANDRDEWELPGGRIDADDATPQETLVREFDEEVGLAVSIAGIIDSWIFDVADKRVLIVTYRCDLIGEWPGHIDFSEEHVGVLLAPIDSLPSNLPQGYRRSIDVAASAVH